MAARGKYSVQAFVPYPEPRIWEIETTDILARAEELASYYATGESETKVVERTDPYSNIGTIIGIWRNGEKRGV